MKEVTDSADAGCGAAGCGAARKDVELVPKINSKQDLLNPFIAL